MISDNGSVAPHFRTSYRTQMEAISKQAEGLKTLGKPEVVAGFLESSFTSTVESFAPGPELSAYAAMVKGTAGGLKERPDLAQGLWETALRVATQGIPGGAGIALAKTVEHVSRDQTLSDQGTIAHGALLEMRVGYGQTLKGEHLQANLALDASANQTVLEHGDLIARNAIKTVAGMEDWQIA